MLYSFDAGHLTLKDEFLSLNFECNFNPERLPFQAKEADHLPSGHRVTVLFSEDFFIREIFLMKDNVRDGEFQLRYPSGQVAQRCFYDKGLLHGPSKYFSENGRLLVSSWFIQGVQQGKSLGFWPSGEKRFLHNFVDGKKWYEQINFYKNGAIKNKFNFKEDLLDGVSFFYDEEGNVIKTLAFKNGKKINE